MATLEETTSLVHWLMARYPNSNWPETTIKAWIDDLSETPINELRAAALTWHRGGHEWPPNAGQLMALAQDLAAGPDNEWESGWQAVMRHLRDCGSYCQHDHRAMFDGPTYNALATIGWYALCMTDLDDLGTVRAQFRDVYRSTAKRERDATRLPAAVRALLNSNGQRQIGGTP